MSKPLQATGQANPNAEIGGAISHRRDEFVLVTKSEKRDGAGCRRSLEESLKNLKCDNVDILLMHGVATMEDLDAILAPGGRV